MQYDMVFEKLYEFLPIDKEKPLCNESFFDDHHPYNLSRPDSPACCMILWLNSIEPPFYEYLKEACRESDEDKLLMLGPFAQCLYWIISRAESKRSD